MFRLVWRLPGDGRLMRKLDICVWTTDERDTGPPLADPVGSESRRIHFGDVLSAVEPDLFVRRPLTCHVARDVGSVPSRIV
jgi:hypothetical protein